MKALVVGRHSSEIPGYEITTQLPMTWDIEKGKVLEQIKEVEKEAAKVGAEIIILQNMPATLAASWKDALERGFSIPWGIIVSVPGERQAGAKLEWEFDDAADANACISMLKKANPNIKLTEFCGKSGGFGVRITVDPPMKFEFSHVSMLS